MANLTREYLDGRFSVENETFDEGSYDEATGYRGLGAGKRSVLRNIQKKGGGMHKKGVLTQEVVSPEAEVSVVAAGIVDAIAEALRNACNGLDRMTQEAISCLELPDHWLGVDLRSTEVERRIADDIRSGNEQIWLAYSAANGG
jgi:hypothetical protein